MKKYLLPQEGTFYKANLHTHSTFSDGRSTPEEFKRAYKNLGYSILALSEHERMVPHHDLTDEEFLFLTAAELGVFDESCEHNFPPVCHFNIIALDEKMDIQPLYHRTKYVKPQGCPREMLKTDPLEPDYERFYTPESITDMMQKARAANFFVIYNHPAWSQESYPQYMNYHGMHAMEIINHTSNVKTGICEYNERVYDDMLRGGKHIYCVATDDSHSIDKHRVGGAWTMIKAERLDYPTVAKALVAGHFYASEGPEIKELWFEDGVVHVKSSPVERIIFTTWPARGRAFWAEESKGTISEAEYTLLPEAKYVRITLVDERGKKAYSNAYFVEELKKLEGGEFVPVRYE